MELKETSFQAQDATLRPGLPLCVLAVLILLDVFPPFDGGFDSLPANETAMPQGLAVSLSAEHPQPHTRTPFCVTHQLRARDGK
jgi:hypothetical protein